LTKLRGGELAILGWDGLSHRNAEHANEEFFVRFRKRDISPCTPRQDCLKPRFSNLALMPGVKASSVIIPKAWLSLRSVRRFQPLEFAGELH
jgi:hypothetical protein